MTLNPSVSYLAKQTPSVFTKVRADGGQQQSLPFYELEDKVSVHAFDGQLPILIFGCLNTHNKTTQGSSAKLESVSSTDLTMTAVSGI